MGAALPIPAWFDAAKADKIWQVDYETRAQQAHDWAKQHNLKPAASDQLKVNLTIVDGQNTFCVPSGELFVGGRSGNGAVDDNVRLSEFIYRNLSNISTIAATMDTHKSFQIFHAEFLINDQGQNPAPFTLISTEDVKNGVWDVNPAVAWTVASGNLNYLQQHLRHYVEMLEAAGKYQLCIWPYHAMLGGVGHALAATLEEALHFHTHARGSQWRAEIKGGHPLTENYSVMAPEVMTTWDPNNPNGTQMNVQRNVRFLEALASFDVVIIAGQAKSHCVAWTIADLLDWMKAKDPKLVEKVYLLEDCSSPVVTPVIDFTDAADDAFQRFADEGMHVVQSTVPMDQWPDLVF